MRHPKSPINIRNSLIFIVRYLMAQKSDEVRKKIATAVYEYQADCDGDWGEIIFDFEHGTAEIVRLADWDTMKTNRFANKAITYLLNCENEKLTKEVMIAFELWD